MNRPLWIKHASQLATLSFKKRGARIKEEMSEIGIIKDGSIWVEDGYIRAIGTTSELEIHYDKFRSDAEIYDAHGSFVTPGLVDPHTHVVYAGKRDDEFEMRLQGATYMEIMNNGGGIHATTSRTNVASEEQLLKETEKRLNSFLEHGVTTIESKSGYGMNLETELKQLRIMKKLQQVHAIDIIPTFMGAHSVPLEYKGRSDAYITMIIEEILPIIHRENLAVFQDVFCEEGVFTQAQAKRLLLEGKKYQLLPKIHADEIVSYGGAELAAEIHAVSAEHLLKSSKKGLQKMAENGVIACLLPATALFLGEEVANGREMIDRGVPVAISTDCNPGSSPTTSMPLVMNLACLLMKMTPKEALTAATYNAACAVQQEEYIGSLEVGKKADIVVWDVEDYRELQYLFGVNHVKTVWKNGNRVVQR